MPRSRRLEIVIAGDAKGAVAALDKTEGATRRTESVFSGLKKAAVGLGAVMAARQLVGDAFEGLKRTEAASAQLEAGLRSTGNAANTTVTGMTGYADALERTTGVEAELVMEGQGLLATFTNVRNEAGLGNDVFNRATQAAVDLSYKGFGSVTDASKMLGKALNDPVAGLTAMARAGVTFSEDQQRLIRSLVDTGDVLGAQKLILDEVERQVGGAAEAYGETLPGKIDRANAAIGAITENLLASAAPALETVSEHVLDLGVDLGLLDSVDIELPQKLLELGDASLDSAYDVTQMTAAVVEDRGAWERLFDVVKSGDPFASVETSEGTKKLQEMDYALSQLVSSGNFDQARRRFDELAQATIAQGGTLEQLQADMPNYTAALGEYEASVAGLSGAERQAALDTDIWASEMEGLDEAVKALTTSYDFLLGRFLTTDEAQIRSRELTRSLTEAVREGQQADETAAEFKDRLSSRLINLVQQLNTEYDSMVSSGEAAGTAASRNQFLNDKLMVLQGTFPGLRGEIEGYRGQLNAVPRDKHTTVTADTSGASGAIAGLQSQIAAVPRSIPLRFTAETAAVSPTLRLLTGNYAEGGIREAHDAQIAKAGEWRVWAEPETGGEAYIPLAKSKAAQSIPIWEETGRRLGVERFYEDGAVIASRVLTTSHTGRGAVDRAPFNLTVHIGTWLGDEVGIRDLAGRITKVQEARLRQAGRR